ncbi:hypothetical protein B296_00052336 [Ensete ventricosum]|uniref:PHD-type domain-containing protein n=1 Tax=Ensete ventricosum TaxID=4639 RepID=A0A426YCS8_ENSVE|nr:hypothetical protein B296_00052336 [Ensete ventricosum]
MAVEEPKSNGFLKLEDSPSNGFIKYRRQKRARPDSDAMRVRWILSCRLVSQLMAWPVADPNSSLWQTRYLGDSEVKIQYQNPIYCSTKPDQTEASDVYKACTCKQCGTEANGEGSLICDGCEAMYHFSCIKPAIKEIPTRSWYCAVCSTNNKDFADAACTEVNKGSLHQNCVVCDRLEVSETLEDHDENDSRIRVAADSGESSVSSMESEETPELSRTAMSCLCKICGTCEDEEKKFLICGHIHCPYKFYHIRCLKSSQIASPHQQNQPCWYCPSCLCRVCFCDKDDDKIVLCDGCDEAYHTYCMKPPRTSVPRGQWYCVACNIARAREGMRRYEQWILQQHRKNEGRQSNEVGGSMDLLLSAAEKLSSEEKLASRR